DSLIEIWQPDDEGCHGPAFTGFGRAATAEDGGYRFRTFRPSCGYITLGVLGRGVMKRLVTRLYFANADALRDDPFMRQAPARRRHTRLARREKGAWRFDIVLRGRGETVFFDC